MSADKAKELGIKPLARIIDWASAGVEPAIMGIGPVPAVRKVMKKTGMTVDQMDLIELNEAFAAQSVYCCRELGLNMDKVNIHGGAIALGHPIGCSGARIIVTLLYAMLNRKSTAAMVLLLFASAAARARLSRRTPVSFYPTIP